MVRRNRSYLPPRPTRLRSVVKVSVPPIPRPLPWSKIWKRMTKAKTTRMTWKCLACQPPQTSDTTSPVPAGIPPAFSPTPTNPFHRARSTGVLHCTRRHLPTSATRASRRDLRRQTRGCMTTMRQTWPRPLDSATLAPRGRVLWPCRPASPRCLRCQDDSWILATRVRA